MAKLAPVQRQCLPEQDPGSAGPVTSQLQRALGLFLLAALPPSDAPGGQALWVVGVGSRWPFFFVRGSVQLGGLAEC